MDDSWHNASTGHQHVLVTVSSYIPEAVICASVSRYSDVASIWRWPHSLSPTARPPVSTVDKRAQQDAIIKPTVQTAEPYIARNYSRYMYIIMYYRSVLYVELYRYTLLHTIVYCIYTHYILYCTHVRM